MKQAVRGDMAANEIVEKVKTRIYAMPVKEHADALIAILQAIEPVVRARYLTREEQIDLLKKCPETWNAWCRVIFTQPMPSTHIQGLSPFVIYEYLTKEMIHLQGVDFSGCDLSSAQFEWGIDLSGCCFDNTDLEGADFNLCVFGQASFRNANLRHVRFSRSVFSDAVFDGADLSYAHGAPRFHGTVSLAGAKIKSTCLVIDYKATPPLPGEEEKFIRGRLVDESGAVKFLADPDAEENVEEWRMW